MYYRPLVHVLRALGSPIGAPALGPPKSSGAGGGSLPPPTPTAFVEVLCACLEPSPNRRLSARSLVRLPFFSRGGSERGRIESIDDLQAASVYMGGSGSEVSPTLALRERVECQVEALEAASAHGAPATHEQKNHKAAAARTTRRIGCASKNFGAGALVEALKELEHLVHRSSPAANYLSEDDHPQQARRIARGHVRVVDEIFESGVLVRASALALRFLGREEVSKYLYFLARPFFKCHWMTGGFDVRRSLLLWALRIIPVIYCGASAPPGAPLPARYRFTLSPCMHPLIVSAAARPP